MGNFVRRIVTGIAGLGFLIRWYLVDKQEESYTTLCIGILAIADVILEETFNLGRDSLSEREREDRYLKKREALKAARDQLKREKNNLITLLDDPKDGEGNEYTETTPFTQLISRVRPLRHYRDYRRSAHKITIECTRILTLPSGQRDVKRLMPLLRKLDQQLARELGEEEVLG